MGHVESKNHHLILLTGCINPAGMHFTTLQNPDVRKGQYIEAINYYLEETSCHILFVENSGYDLSSAFANKPLQDQERMEFLTFDGNNYDKQLGKGYGEMLILNYAIKHSSFIKESLFICKITGRYKILNINTLIDFYIHSKSELMALIPQRLNFADSRIFISDGEFYKNKLLKYQEMLNDSEGCYFEHVLSKAVLEAVIDGTAYLPFKHRPRFSGQSGTADHFYPDGFLYWWPRNLLYKLRFKLSEHR